jgi:diacylglycerol kinase family enzyme
MAGVGADAFIIDRVGPTLKRFLGVAAYWITGITKFWSYPMQPFRVKIGDQSYAATFAVISNSRYYGGHLLVTPHASVFEDSLDVCLFNSGNHLRFLAYLWGSLKGKHLQYPDVVYKKTRALEVVGDRNIHVQLDGELVGFLPTKFSTSESHLQVVVP